MTFILLREFLLWRVACHASPLCIVARFGVPPQRLLPQKSHTKYMPHFGLVAHGLVYTTHQNLFVRKMAVQYMHTNFHRHFLVVLNRPPAPTHERIVGCSLSMFCFCRARTDIYQVFPHGLKSRLSRAPCNPAHSVSSVVNILSKTTVYVCILSRGSAGGGLGSPTYPHPAPRKYICSVRHKNKRIV